MNLAALLRRTARSFPALPAVAAGESTLWSYAALEARVAALAGSLRAVGLAPGDRVAIVSRNCPEYVELLFAAWRAGLAAVPVNAKLHPQEVAYILADSGARAAFVDAAWHDALSPLASGIPLRVVAIGGGEYRALVAGNASADGDSTIAELGPDAPAWLFYTSGTTGRPKGVVLSHRNLLAMSEAFLSSVETIEPGDATLHAAPMSHGSGLYVIPHVLRGAVNVVPESGRFDADEVFAAIRRWPGLSFFAAPTMVARLVRSGHAGSADVSRLKSIIFGGGPMYVEDCRAAWRVFPGQLAQIYGQGESPMTITAMDRTRLADAMARDDAPRIASVGVAQCGVELVIAGEAGSAPPAGAGAAIMDGAGAAVTGAVGAALPAGEVGEVLVRGPTVMQGYWNNPAASAAALASGWLRTGDLGVLDRDGFLQLKDRSKDVIISGGANIYPREVEEVLLRHPRVAEVAVVGRRHAEWGEEVVACIATAGGEPIATGELDALCLAAVARFKRPREYRFFPELPKNDAGKVLKTRLRELVAQA